MSATTTTTTTETKADGTVVITTVTTIPPPQASSSSSSSSSAAAAAAALRSPSAEDFSTFASRDPANDTNCVFNRFYPEGAAPPAQMAKPGEGQEITKEWLSGVINAPVASFECNAAAMGQVGVTFMITDIVYDGATPAGHPAPKSLAIKMHALAAEGRAFAVGAKFYEKELWFFGDFAAEFDGLDFEIPKVYAMFRDNTPISVDPASPGTAFFNLVMEDLNTVYQPYNVLPGATPSWEQHRDAMACFKSMYIKFFEWSDPRFSQPPLSYCGPEFKWLDFTPLMAVFHQTWPALKQNMPIMAGWVDPATGKNEHGTDHGFPPQWEKFIKLAEKLAANESKGALACMDSMNKLFTKRPMTFIHGDLNCGNFWVNKSDPSKYLLADWQALRMGTIAMDFFTQFCCTDAFRGKGQILGFLKEFHDSLPENVRAKYTFDFLVEDLKACSFPYIGGIIALAAGQLATPMPQEKKDFTWKVFWPQGFGRCLDMFDQLDGIYEYMEALADA